MSRTRFVMYIFGAPIYGKNDVTALRDQQVGLAAMACGGYQSIARGA